MKSVLISIQPNGVEKIANGKKTIEVRKTKPNLETPFKVYIYCTNNKRQYLRKLGTSCREIFITENKDIIGKTDKVKYLIGETTTFWESSGYNGKVIGEFVCDKLENIFSRSRFWLNEDTLKSSCLSAEQIWDYANGAEKIYGWHISDLKIYDKPKELSEFTPICRVRKDLCKVCCFYEEVFGGCCRTLTRPPQSWCYVEDIQE